MSSAFEKMMDQLENAGATAAGGADELSFGLSNKYIPGAKKLTEDNPWASNIGRVGSYAVPLPLPNKLKALIRAPEGAAAIVKQFPKLAGLMERLSKHGLAAGQNLLTEGASKIAGKATEKLGEGYLAKGVKGAAEGVLSGEGQHEIRRQLGTSDDTASPSSTKDRLLAESAFGFGGGMLGQVMKKLAPKAYNHPALINRNDLDNSRKEAGELLNQGVWGSLDDTFRPHAEKLKDQIQVTRDTLVPRAVQNEQKMAQDAAEQATIMLGGAKVPKPRGVTPVSDIRQAGKVAANKMRGHGDAARAQMESEFEHSIDQLKPDQYGFTTLGDVNRGAKDINTDIKNTFSSSDKGKSFGDLDGSLSAQKKRMLELKDAHDQALLEGIDMHGNTAADNAKIGVFDDKGNPISDTEIYGKARETYGKGRNLENNLLDYDRSQQGKGTFFNADLLRNLLRGSIAAAPIRTGLGVALDRLAPKVSVIGGRTAELRSRKNGPKKEENNIEAAQPESTPEQDEFEQFVPKGEFPGPSPEEKAASAKKLGMQKVELDIASNPEKHADSKEAKKWAERFDNKMRTKKMQVDDAEEENPFDQFVPE